MISVLACAQFALADNATLLVSPATATKTAGTSFNVAVQVNPTGNQVCVAKGTLVFTNLTCQSISVASGLMAQTTPTCASPSFILGIPNCTTALQNLLTIYAKGTAEGQGAISFSGAKIAGAGSWLTINQQGGTYTITAVQVQAPEEPVEVVTEEEVVQQTEQAEKPAEQLAEQPAALTALPIQAQTASLTTALAGFFSSPVVIVIIVVIAAVLLILWLTDKMPFMRKK